MENQNGVRPRLAPKQLQQLNVVDGTANNGNANAANYNADKQKSVTDRSSLGPLHWIAIIIYIIAVYFLCVKVDDRLPAPLSAREAGDHRFSEERARMHLNTLADFGPRVAGSDAAEIHARNYILMEIENVRSRMDGTQYRLDVDVQKPSGCFGLIFLSNFTLCYKNLTNIVVRLGRRSADDRPATHSLLLNCHFDSVSQSPGASDDAVSCAIMLELLNMFSRQDPKFLPYDLVFLFNGAEENFLQASHGFITSHPWRHSVRAFINLEGAGAGGREMLFQSGPANIWLMHAYLDNAPHPHCSIMAQEIFQSGLIPGDTDFRILRDFGRVPGMDIAYIKNGYVYHTEFDRPEFISPGSIQRGGENIFATVAGIIRSPCFTKPCPQQETRLVYFDIIGLFVVQYPLNYGTFLNYAVVALIILRIFRQIQQHSAAPGDGGYSFIETLGALGIHIVAIIFMLATTYTMILLTNILGLTMAWYSSRVMVLVLYALPALISGFSVHALWNGYVTPVSPAANLHYSPFRMERVTFDTALLLFAIILFGLTWKGLGSAYYALLHALFPLLRDVLLWIYGALFGERSNSASRLLIAHSIAIFPVIVLGSYGMISVLQFFIPIMGRSGPGLNPELLIGGIGWTSSLVIVLYMAGMVYISRAFGEILKFTSCVTALVIAVAAFTDFGAPYVYRAEEPRLRRLHIQHVSRTIYAPDGRVNSSENALFLASLDYRGVQDLPPTTFLQGSGPPPCIPEDAFCGLPYYVAVKDMFPPHYALWMPVPSAPVFEKPISIKLLSKEEQSVGLVKMTFSLTGYDHMTVFITPLNNWMLDSWSVTSELLDRGRVRTHFLYLAYVGEADPWIFSLTLKKTSSQQIDHPDEPRLLIGVASHYMHGKNQYTPQTKALIESIRERRSKPPTATLGYWKWAMTPDGFNSEYIAKYF